MSEKNRYFIIGLVVVAGSMIWSSEARSWFGESAPTAQSSTISIGTTQVSEGDDFATRILRHPWDMTEGPQPDFPTVFGFIDRASFNSSGGIWQMTTLGNDPGIWLLPSGISNTQEVLKLGDRYPIDSSHYSLLSFYLCSDSAGTSNILWFLDQSPHTQFAESYFISIDAACNLYVVDLNEIGVLGSHGGVTDWAGQIKGLRLDPISQGTGVQLQADWVRLTNADTSNIVPINWSDINSGSVLHFYLNSSCSSTDAIPVGTMTRSGASSGTFQWGAALQPDISIKQPYPLPESFQPGEYTVLMRVDGTGVPVCAADLLEIRKAPILDFINPSKTSGPKYASVEVGDPWGMANSEDISYEGNIGTSSITDGVYSAINSSGDPGIHLNLLTNVNSNDYRYITYRMKVDGIQDIGVGWVGRIFWWNTGPGIDAVATRDMILYEGWQTYTLNLDEVLIEPSNPGSWSGSPIVFRVDPHEIPTPNDFHLDYVQLTGDNQINVGSPYPLNYTLTPLSGASITFYYDNDQDSSNGRTVMQEYSQPAPPHPYLMFMPISERDYFSPEIPSVNGLSWVWDTTGVPQGTYYVCAEVTDGVNTITWYSDVPITVIN